MSAKQTVTVPNEKAMGLEAIEKESGVEVPVTTLNEMQGWAMDMTMTIDTVLGWSETETFGEYKITVECHNSHSDDVIISDDDYLSTIDYETFVNGDF